MNDLDAASIRALYGEHGAALWRYAVRLTTFVLVKLDELDRS